MLAGCGDSPPPQPAPLGGTDRSPLGPDAQQAITPATSPPAMPALPMPTDAFIGRWTGPEGLVLDIRPRPDAGERRYDIAITLLDGTEHHVGRPKLEAIVFDRNGRDASIRAGTGNDTGLKWLAGKRDCLIIQPGEGFCRK
jgi:hypothetical protein